MNSYQNVEQSQLLVSDLVCVILVISAWVRLRLRTAVCDVTFYILC